VGKVRLTLELNDQDAYDSELIKVLRSSSESERKGLIVSSVLYYTRSPAFQLTNRIDRLLEALAEGSPKAAIQTYLSPPEAPALVVPTSPAAVPGLASKRLEKSSETLLPKTFDDGSDDVFGNLFRDSAETG